MTKLDDVVVPLLSARIFSGLSPMQLKSLALEAEAVTFKRGELLIRTYQEGDAAYLIGSGTVVEQGDDDEPAREFGVGTMIGELAMLVETLHSSTIVARSQVRALRFKREAVHALMEKDPVLADHFVGKMRARLAETAVKLREVDRLFASPSYDDAHMWRPS